MTLGSTFFLGESLWKKVEPNVITYYLPSMRVENGLFRKFFGGLAERSPDGTLKFYHGDHLGSASLVTDLAGTVIRRQAYMPYGEDRAVSGSFTDARYQFNFKEKESTGFYDYGARLYNPVTGRWLSPDSLIADGLNRYAYVQNNPLRYTDPTGHQIPFFSTPSLGTWGSIKKDDGYWFNWFAGRNIDDAQAAARQAGYQPFFAADWGSYVQIASGERKGQAFIMYQNGSSGFAPSAGSPLRASPWTPDAGTPKIQAPVPSAPQHFIEALNLPGFYAWSFKLGVVSIKYTSGYDGIRLRQFASASIDPTPKDLRDLVSKKFLPFSVYQTSLPTEGPFFKVNGSMGFGRSYFGFDRSGGVGNLNFGVFGTAGQTVELGFTGEMFRHP